MDNRKVIPYKMKNYSKWRSATPLERYDRLLRKCTCTENLCHIGVSDLFRFMRGLRHINKLSNGWFMLNNDAPFNHFIKKQGI
jgi:hypothetical protein